MDELTREQQIEHVSDMLKKEKISICSFEAIPKPCKCDVQCTITNDT